MQFQTWTFALFLVIALSVYCALGRSKLWLPWLVLVSFGFYWTLKPLFVVYLLYAIVADYVIVGFMTRSPRPRRWIWVSVLNNLALLAFFKYTQFAVDNLNELVGMVGGDFLFSSHGLVFPIGVSFYVFRSLTYSIDCYRGEIPREKNFIRHAAFMSFFPILIAGPIERAKTLLPRLREFPGVTRHDVADGASLFVLGLFKKVAIANYLADYVNAVYAVPELQGGASLIIATVMYAWQIYFDFSGYSDMARGIARLFGFRIMLNFDNPYMATSMSDFWRRWHISLSTWFRDYVYIPLGGNRKGTFALVRNLLITFVISGLWHGAAWTFVIWGFLHGVGIILNRRLDQVRWYSQHCPKVVKQLLVFGFTCFAWIFFRAATVEDAFVIVGRIFTAPWTQVGVPALALALVAGVWVYQFAYDSKLRRLLASPYVRMALMTAMILYLCFVSGSPDKPFVYQKF